MDTSTLVSTLRHRRKLFLSLLAVSLLVLLGFGHPRVREHASTLWDDRIGRGDEPAASKGLGGGHGPAGGYTRIVGGLDGFFVLENVFVKDRRLYLVQDPAAPALPPLHKIITSTVPDTYDASNLIERLRNPAAAAYDPRSPDFDPEVAGRWKDNDNYPDVPRLVVLSSEEAETVIPRSGEAMGREHGWWPAVDGRHGVDAVTVLDGTTFYLADDAAQIGWGALMHHYFHFVGELLLGTYHAYQSAALLDDHGPHDTAPHHPPPEIIDDLGARNWLPWANTRPASQSGDNRDPARIVIPWTTSWQGKDFDELIVRNAFGGAPVIDRAGWTKWNSDHKWRMFSRMIITDRNAAHNDYWSQTSIWNKMALNVLSQPLPTQTPPVNFFARPQQALAQQLGVSEYPARRPGTEESFERGKGLVSGEVRIVYVDRQRSDRKLDDESNAALLDILNELQQERPGHHWPRVVVEHVKFEDMHADEQIKTAMRADIWLGIHGNGLTHLVWTPSGATVIELFPVNSFLRDYQILSYALQHQYSTVWRDRVIESDEWGTERGGGVNPTMLHDSTPITIDKNFIRDLLERAIRDMS